MNIVYLCPRKTESCCKVKRILDLIVSPENNKIFHKVSEFEKYARSSSLHQQVIILQARDMKCLQKIAAIKELLFGYRVIMILQDREHATVALGHSLRPRFITYQDSDFLEMAYVLCKMREQERNGLSNWSEDLLATAGKK